jgi:diacylglycerol kinase
MNEQKEVGLIKNFFNKCKYSLDGLDYCFKNESSFVLVSITACIIIILGILFDIKFIEWVLSFGSLCLIMIIELINTAIEAIVDMVTSEYNEFAKIAKDCGSAATGLMGVLAAMVNLIIFVPYIIGFIIK